MASGIRGRANPDYTQTEYAQPWGGIDLSKPSSQIEPSSAITFTGSIIRGAITNGAGVTPPTSSVPTTLPVFAVGERPILIANLNGATVIVTQVSVFTNLTAGTSSKAWQKIATGVYCAANGTHIGSLIIGKNLYFSSSSALGVYQVNGLTVTEITDHGSGSGPFIGGDFLFTVSDRLCLWNIIGGDGNQNTPTPSTNTNYPDRVAWSFPFAPGFFDPNSALTPGGFQQITEARGLGTGVAVFEAVAMLAHNGGFTEMVPNTSVIAGTVLTFSFAPLWSADQGVVCRYGSMAQYGAMCCFLGNDQPYQLSPGGLQPFGNKVASVLQNLSYWNDGDVVAGGFFGINSGLYGSIVEIEGEKHYLLSFASTLTATTERFTQIYDCHLKDDSWSTWRYDGFTMTTPVYQSNDEQLIAGSSQIARDNWLLFGYITGSASFIPTISQFVIGQTLFPLSSLLYTANFSTLFRAETPNIFIPQTRRRLLVEYENIPGNASVDLNCVLYGQPIPGAYPSTSSAPIISTFDLTLTYYPASGTVPANAVLTAFSDPSGTAFTSLATSIQLSTAGNVRIIRAAMVDEITQAEQK